MICECNIDLQCYTPVVQLRLHDCCYTMMAEHPVQGFQKSFDIANGHYGRCYHSLSWITTWGNHTYPEPCPHGWSLPSHHPSLWWCCHIDCKGSGWLPAFSWVSGGSEKAGIGQGGSFNCIPELSSPVILCDMWASRKVMLPSFSGSSVNLVLLVLSIVLRCSFSSSHLSLWTTSTESSMYQHQILRFMSARALSMASSSRYFMNMSDMTIEMGLSMATAWTSW